MITLLNTLFLVMVYVILVALMLSQTIYRPNRNDDDNDNNSGDGGWDDNDGNPPLDLPPGVYVLPPDDWDEQSPIRKKEQEAFV